MYIIDQLFIKLNHIKIIIQILFINWLKKIGVLVRRSESLDD
jgi:hypothetical protein